VFTLIIKPNICPSIINPQWNKEFEMVAKTLKKKVQTKSAKSKSAAPVFDSAKEVLYAGLGAFSVAQQEGEKLIEESGKFFDKLVAEGAKLEKKSLDIAENAVEEIKADVENTIDDVRKQANENWDSLGNIFDERVLGALERLGIPTTKDMNKLSGRVQTMSRKATNSWKEFEGVFEKRVSAVLESLHIPGADDLNKVSESVQKISSDAVKNLSKMEQTFEKRVADVFGKFEATTNDELKKLHSGVQDVTRQVNDNWGKLEGEIDKRVAKVMGGLKLPSANETKKLTADLKKLSTQVAALEKQLKANAKVKPAPRKAAPKKALAPKAETKMTVVDKKKAAEAISKMKPVSKPATK